MKTSGAFRAWWLKKYSVTKDQPILESKNLYILPDYEKFAHVQEGLKGKHHYRNLQL